MTLLSHDDINIISPTALKSNPTKTTRQLLKLKLKVYRKEITPHNHIHFFSER